MSRFQIMFLRDRRLRQWYCESNSIECWKSSLKFSGYEFSSSDFVSSEVLMNAIKPKQDFHLLYCKVIFKFKRNINSNSHI